MKARRIWLCLFAIALGAAPAFAAARRPPAPQPTPQQGAAAFYDAYLRLHLSGIPDGPQRNRLRPYLTTRLHDLLQSVDRAETRHAELTRHEEPPLIEGDVFTALFEGATSFAVGMCQSDSDMMASCKVDLTYKTEGQPDTHWTDTVVLVREQRRFRVDDIAYGGTWPFSNKGKLSGLLNETLSHSEAPAN